MARKDLLRALLDERYQGSQAAMARALGRAPSQIHQWLSGHRAIGDAGARHIELTLGLPPGYFNRKDVKASQTLQRESKLKAIRQGTRATDARRDAITHIARTHGITHRAGGSIGVAHFDARASMGAGAPIPDHDTVVDTLHLSREWVRSSLPGVSAPANLAFITGYGDSMEDTYRSGDILLVDRGVQDVRLDAVYLYDMDGELFIKRLQRLPGGALKVISDNKKYESHTLDDDSRSRMRVLGRIVWAWNGRKL